MTGTSNDREKAMPTLALIVVPDPEEDGAAEVLIDGTINGFPYRFLLDTGAARTSIVYDDHTARLASTGSHAASGVFGHASEDLVTVPEIALGPVSWRDVTVARMHGGPAQARGLIGMDLLKEYCCDFDFARNTLALARDARPAPGEHPLLLDSRFHPYVDVSVAGASGHAVWDTGASLTIADMAFVENNRESFAPAGTSTGTDATGARVETPMYVLRGLRVGETNFPPHRVAGVDLSPVNARIEIPMDLILGYSTLRSANWSFDFPGRQWAITRGPAR